MAEDLRAFWPDNAVREALEVVVSERFCDESGEAIKWRIEPLVAADLQAIYREGGRESAGLRLLAAAVSLPDLADAELQDKYGVMGAEQLLLKMLSPGEFGVLERAFAEVNLC